jgi:lipoprotein-releasing system permease protein
MLRPFSLFVGLRYSFARKRNLLLSFVSLISMLGISLGVLILIVALAVINGSINTLRDEALKSVPHVTLSGPGMEQNYQAYLERARSEPRIIAAAPFVEGEVLLRYQGEDQFVRLRGVDPASEAEVVDDLNRSYQALLSALAQSGNGIVLGTQLAGGLGIFGRGEVSATALRSLLARDLSSRQGFAVTGFADFGVYGNNNIAVAQLDQVRALLGADAPLQIRLKVDDVLQAEAIAAAVYGSDDGVTVLPWNQAQASLFNALNMEKFLTGFMLLMIVLIGAVNIISTLVMVVADKGADIAILRTMGASRTGIMIVFIVQGMIAGLVGTLLGTLAGVLLAQNISAISLSIEQAINSVFSGANVYLLSHLQTQIYWGEVVVIGLAAMLISFLATLYPAYRASRVQPAAVLRYE